jgi:hypothetical protein
MLLSLPSIWAKTAGSAVRTLRCAFFQVTSLDRPITLPRGGEGDEDSSGNTRQQQKHQQQQPPNHTNRPLPIKVLLEHSDGFMVPFVITSNTEQHHPPTTTIISLHDYHRAFLRSPVFQLEFWILRMCGLVAAESVSWDRLDRVAAGTANSFALWSTIYRESSSASSQTVVMRCTTPSSDRVMVVVLPLLIPGGPLSSRRRRRLPWLRQERRRRRHIWSSLARPCTCHFATTWYYAGSIRCIACIAAFCWPRPSTCCNSSSNSNSNNNFTTGSRQSRYRSLGPHQTMHVLNL